MKITPEILHKMIVDRITEVEEALGEPAATVYKLGFMDCLGLLSEIAKATKDEHLNNLAKSFNVNTTKMSGGIN